MKNQNIRYSPSKMALFFFFFIDFAVLTFEMTATNLKAYSRPPEDHTSTALNGYFPCGLLVFYHLVSTAQKQLSACRRFKKKEKKKECILSAHTKRILSTVVKAQPETLHDALKEK